MSNECSRFEMIESVEHIKPILALNTLVMVLFTMAICFTKVSPKPTFV